MSRVIDLQVKPHRLLAVAASLGLLLVNACSGSPQSINSQGKVGNTLTIAISAAPNFNPYLADTNPYNQWVLSAVYSPLVRQQADLSFKGDLAESYKYTDDQNKVFEINLRPNLKFADGSKLDANAVVASLNYFLKVGVNARTYGGTIASITATGPLTITVTNKTPNPQMPFVFSQAAQSGHIISPAGLADPTKMGLASYGAGPYTVDTSQTIANSKYVFVPNPNYWDQAKIHWKKIVALLIADPSASVKAIQAGQVDFTGSAVNLLPEVQASGLPYYTGPAGVVGISLSDRDGAVSAPLKDQRVRQALNYAIDRQSILHALYADHGTPTDQLNSPGWEGYDAASNNKYGYDVAKAKQLLSDAGYANGFSVNMVVFSFIGLDVLAQAVIAQWKQIGVNVDLKVDPSIPQEIGDAMSRKYAMTGLAVLNTTAYLLSTSYFLPVPNPANPFASSDPQLLSLLGQAAATVDPAQRGSLYQQAIARAVDLAWFAPVVTIDGVFVADNKISGWKSPFFDVVNITPA